MGKQKFITKALHTRYTKDDIHGALRMPVYDTASFEYKNAEDIEAAFRGTKPGHVYSRSTNPTVEYLEKIITNLTDSLGTIAFSSGMAAISNLLLAISKSGDNIITSKNIFGNTYSLFEKTLKAFGVNFRYADLSNPKSIEPLIDINTTAIFFETITNPQLEVANIKALSEIAKKNNLILISDSTLTPPYLFNSIEHGVNIEIISSTKYISGGASSLGGIIIDNGNYDWGKLEKLKEEVEKFGHFALIAKIRKEIHRNTGACMSPHNAYLQTLGIETLGLRADKSCENTIELAQFLETLSQVTMVNYPGLESSEYYEICNKQFKYPGSILTLELETKEKCYDFINKLKIIRRATNLNDNKTLIIHPASTIFSEYNEKTLKELGVSDTLIRLAVGIEDVDDLKEDIRNAIDDC